MASILVVCQGYCSMWWSISNPNLGLGGKYILVDSTNERISEAEDKIIPINEHKSIEPAGAFRLLLAVISLANLLKHVPDKYNLILHMERQEPY